MMYRLAAQDYLAASNSRWYAGVEVDDNDPQKYFQRAYEHYAKLPGKPARMLASRAALLSATYLQAAARFLPASVILMRAHFERKFAFQMVLAGLRIADRDVNAVSIHSIHWAASTQPTPPAKTEAVWQFQALNIRRCLASWY
ncbi:uncharacterized protein HaLaN_11917 [Haematococcus lacustris]|uniref:Uncharacterized protein n=1 Tax=Haematococcus lacustris TaxID=44745 RepID=A0A699YZD2_HAELA|nr:uncharacterized protein HaLaN_11917 [Haematococcus lacustris]